MIFLRCLSCCQRHKGSERHSEAALRFSGGEAAALRPPWLSCNGHRGGSRVSALSPNSDYQRPSERRSGFPPTSDLRSPRRPPVTERLHFSRLPKQSSPLSDGDAPSSHPPQIFTIIGAVLTFLCHKYFGPAYRSPCSLCVPG